MIAVVERNEHAGFRARKKKPFPFAIITDDARDAFLRQSVIDWLPTLAVIACAVEARMRIKKIVYSKIGRRGIKMRCLDNADQAPVVQSGGGNVLPACAAIARHL